MAMLDVLKMEGRVALVLCAISLLLNIIGLATPYWVYSRTGLIHIGLWKSCSFGQCISLDSGIVKMFITEEQKSKIIAVRAMEILGMIGVAAATLCVLLKMTVKKENEMLPRCAGPAALFAGIFMLIGILVFDSMSEYKNFGIGFVLCIVAAIFAFAAIASGQMCKKLNKQENTGAASEKNGTSYPI